MSSYANLLAEDIRLCLLQLLAEDADYAANDYVLGRALEGLGHTLSSDRLRTELAWLAEQGLITTHAVGDSMLTARITQRGLDAARGASRVPGVARPRPE